MVPCLLDLILKLIFSCLINQLLNDNNIFQAAFRNNTVGLPKYPVVDTLREINQNTLHTFLRSYFTPTRMTVAAVGVDHEELCQLSEKYVSCKS